MKFDLQNDCELENYFSVKGVAPIEIMIVTFMNAIHLSGSLSFYLSVIGSNCLVNIICDLIFCKLASFELHPYVGTRS